MTRPLSPEMVRLVIAARVVAFGSLDSDAIKELDKASEAFADQVPWDDEPESAGAAVTVIGDTREGGAT